jgi:2-(1,2-epoxy-1,2-dihydrophenyl)acetyl-CoA isomerase
MTYTKIIFELEGDVAIIRLNDEKTLNAATAQMADEIQDALHKAVRSARALVLTGAGRGFCSGVNLGDVPQTPGFDVGRVLETHFNPLMLTLKALPMPFITAVNGAAAGIGCSFALAGDIVLASEKAFFLQAFRQVGLIPDGGAAYLLTRAAGRVRAMEMMLLGERIPAQKALEWGLVNRVLPPAELEAGALALARDLAAGPTKGLAAIRALCWDALETDYKSQLERERVLQREAGLTADHREGVRAFFEKRPPRFEGR